MSKTKLTVNSKTLFPIEQLKDQFKEALNIAKDLSPAIITQNNRPAYAIVRIDDDHNIDRALAEQIALARSASKGTLTIEPYWREKG